MNEDDQGKLIELCVGLTVLSIILLVLLIVAIVSMFFLFNN